jgi:hypothetical protein
VGAVVEGYIEGYIVTATQFLFLIHYIAVKNRL